MSFAVVAAEKLMKRKNIVRSRNPIRRVAEVNVGFNLYLPTFGVN